MSLKEALQVRDDVSDAGTVTLEEVGNVGCRRMIELTLLSDVSRSVASNFPKGERARRRTSRANIGPNKLPKQAIARIAWSLASNAFI